MSTVFVTGAAKNTGYAIAEKFASQGFDVAISTREQATSDKVAKELSDIYGIKAKGYVLDIKYVDKIKEVFEEIKKDFGRLDTFVANSAALGVGYDILSVTEQDYDDLMDVNLKGTYFCCQSAAKIMKDQGGGSIVIISSVHSHETIWGRSLYTVSKGGLNALAKSLAIELGVYKIRANAIICGAIKTDRWNGLTDEQIAQKRANWPIGLESTGEDIANGAYYLGTDLSKTVTGTELTIDSGVLVSLLPFNGGKH